MMYDISGISREDKVLEVFPHLSYHQPFADYGSGADDVWLRFIIYYCDEESPFAHLFTEDRLFACIDAAGIPEDDPRLGEVLRWESESIQEMAARLFGKNPPKQLTTNEGILSMAVEYRRLQFPTSFDVHLAIRKLHWEVVENTLIPITEENSARQIRIAEALSEKLRIADGLLEKAAAIDAMAAKMRKEERAREARKRSREERISKGVGPEKSSANAPLSEGFISEWVGLLKNLKAHQLKEVAEEMQLFTSGKAAKWAGLILEAQKRCYLPRAYTTDKLVRALAEWGVAINPGSLRNPSTEAYTWQEVASEAFETVTNRGKN